MTIKRYSPEWYFIKWMKRYKDKTKEWLKMEIIEIFLLGFLGYTLGKISNVLERNNPKLLEDK